MRLFAPTAVESGKYDEEIIEAVSRYVEERLTPQTSRIIRMHFDEEQSYKEISNSLGISLSAVNKHIVQGLRKLRSTFKNREARRKKSRSGCFCTLSNTRMSSSTRCWTK
jgi:RNA polymerase sigma-70 factor (ECF subfamily)